MGRSFVLQEWTTLSASAALGKELSCPRDAILWAGDCRQATVTVEVSNIVFSVAAPTIRLRTASAIDGPWLTIASVSEATDDETFFFSRDPSEPAPDDRLRGFLKWDLEEPASGSYSITFRITAVLD